MLSIDYQKTDRLFFGLSVALVCLLAACAGSGESPGFQAEPLDLEPVLRLEREIYALESEAEIRQYLESRPLVAKYYFKSERVSDMDALAAQVHACVSFGPNDTLLSDAQEAFPDTEGMRRQFAKAFANVKHHFPDFVPPRLATMVSGFGSFGFGGDLTLSDSLLVVGLDYFGGEAMTFRPRGVDGNAMPDYLLARYEPEYVVPGAMRLLGDKYNRSDFLDRTLLADMIAHGKIYYFMEQALPSVPEHVLIGYTEENVVDCYDNEAVIWEFFTQNKLFYETSNHKKRKLVGEAPKTPQLSERAPGRIGQWLGWQIVRSYMANNPEVTLADLMAQQDAKAIFSASGYRPEQ